MAAPPGSATYMSKSYFDNISDTIEARNFMFGTDTP